MDLEENLTKPRSETSIFITLFAITALPFGISMYIILGLNILITGISFGILFALFMTPLLKTDKKIIHLTSKNTITKIKEKLIIDLGYTIEYESKNLYIFKPTFHAGLIAGRISITINQKTATITGPKLYVTKI
ncbi:hypothetical protein [Methanoculleus sp.]|uniref:hypothetical protein n=1 Tax=Methanoculleus sp. TaxID=90427 RepID=UPI0025FCE618|nr:hypothetical protein [Methanoculleus sp.]MCK9319907.1 hypothetical protein [Methanoculleus sp.]